MLNGCTGKCARLSRPLVGFRTHVKSLHFHSCCKLKSNLIKEQDDDDNDDDDDDDDAVTKIVAN